VRSDDYVSLTEAFITVTFYWPLDTSPSGIAGVGPFNSNYIYPNTTPLTYDSILSFAIALNYGGEEFVPYQALALPASDQNTTTTLYAPPLSGTTASALNTSILSLFPAADTVILRGALSLETEWWELESGNANLTCGLWASQSIVNGTFDAGIQICLGFSSSDIGNSYLLAGTKLCVV